MDTTTATREPIMLEWHTCGGCGRPCPQRQGGCIAVCTSIARKVAEGIDPYDAARAHLAPGYALPTTTATPGPCTGTGGDHA